MKQKRGENCWGNDLGSGKKVGSHVQVEAWPWVAAPSLSLVTDFMDQDAVEGAYASLLPIALIFSVKLGGTTCIKEESTIQLYSQSLNTAKKLFN